MNASRADGGSIDGSVDGSVDSVDGNVDWSAVGRVLCTVLTSSTVHN